MRNVPGVKLRFAQEFSGFAGSMKEFKALTADAANTSQYHKYYGADDIRKIRTRMLNLGDDVQRTSKTLPPIIDLRMPKGGVGKTTMAANLSACMAFFGHRVLLIDGDPQASLTGLFGIDWVSTPITHIGALMERAAQGQPADTAAAIVPLYKGGMLDLIPADISMSATENRLGAATNREQVFNRLLKQEIDFFSQYDAIIIDSAPSTSILTTNFMMAGKNLLVPCMPEGQAVEAMKILDAHLYELNSAFPGLDLDIHIVVNKYNQGKAPHNEWIGRLVELYPGKINETPVRDFIGFLREINSTAIENSGPVIETEPQSVGARDIIDLTKSLIKFYDVRLADLTPNPLATAAA